MNQNNVSFEAFEAECLSLKDLDAFQICKSKPIYIFGAGAFGRAVAKALRVKNFDVSGFIETEPRQKVIDDLPVLCWDDLNQEDLLAQLLIGIYNRDAPFDALLSIARSAGFRDILMPWDVYSQLCDQLGWRYWLSDKEIIINNINRIQETYDLLSDEESKQTLLNICKFRLGLNDRYASFRHEENQYFNPLTLNHFVGSENLTYVDCGAYNGDTFIEAEENLSLTTAYLFEPDPVNFHQLVEVVNQSSVTPICLPLAVSEHYQILSFSGGGEGGAISIDGSVHIAAVSLDELLPNSKVDFIKFDVEGAEIPAIKGAKKLIKHSRPVIVLSLYHRPSDLWEIPDLISSLCSGYKFFIRQHYYNSFDCVFYAVPAEL